MPCQSTGYAQSELKFPLTYQLNLSQFPCSRFAPEKNTFSVDRAYPEQ